MEYEKQRQSLFGRIMKRILIILMILLVLFLVFIFAFRITTVNIYGNVRYTDEEIKSLIRFDEESNNSVIYYLQNRSLSVDSIPFIEAIHIRFGGPQTIDIEVVEKILIGCIYAEAQYFYFDNEGIIAEVSGTSQVDVPLIEGLDFGELVQGQALDVESSRFYEDLLELALLLNKYSMDIEKVIFSETYTMTLQLGNVRVLLGTSANLEDKIAALYDLAPELQNLSGVLHLENYDSTKESIIFSKDS